MRVLDKPQPKGKSELQRGAWPSAPIEQTRAGMGPRRLIRARQLRRKTPCLAMREDEVTAPAEAQQDGRELALVVGVIGPCRLSPGALIKRQARPAHQS